jgi:hypothetical protein
MAYICNGVIYTNLKQCIEFKLLNEKYGITTTDIKEV